MLQWTSRAPKVNMPAHAGVALGVGGQTQIPRTLRKALFPRGFFKGAGVLELNGAKRVREFHRCAEFPSGATARGVGYANASCFTR